MGPAEPVVEFGDVSHFVGDLQVVFFHVLNIVDSVATLPELVKPLIAKAGVLVEFLLLILDYEFAFPKFGIDCYKFHWIVDRCLV